MFGRGSFLRLFASLTLGQTLAGVSASAASEARAEEAAPSAEAGANIGFIAPIAPPEPDARPWRLADALQAPPWLRMRLQHRSRYEYLWGQFRSGFPGNDGGYSLRTLMHLEADLSDRMFIAGEVQDSRFYPDDTLAPINTTLSNPLEPLQAHAGLRFKNWISPGSETVFKAGRFTLDIGSRRLAARNLFRNTLNGHTGFDALWESSEGSQARVFATMPHQRLPAGGQGLRENEVILDRESLDRIFWGAFFRSAPDDDDWRLEGYVFGLHERDSAELASRNRRLLTPGTRVFRPRKRGRIDANVEAVVQVGKSRATSQLSDGRDLEHEAGFASLEAGYTLEHRWKPRLVLQHDYATGDQDPSDDLNGRFDTLFGARRFEYGPTGIFGLIARGNINSPGARVELRPNKRLDAYLGHRVVWLAQARDAWTTSGVVDPSGSAGAFIGQLTDFRIRWRPWLGNALVELGGARAWLGGVATDAPNATGTGRSDYLYSSVVAEF